MNLRNRYLRCLILNIELAPEIRQGYKLAKKVKSNCVCVLVCERRRKMKNRHPDASKKYVTIRSEWLEEGTKV